MTFTAATADQVLAIRVNAGIEELAGHDRFAAASPDMVEAIVEGIGQFAAGEFAPLNRKGDLEGAQNAFDNLAELLNSAPQGASQSASAGSQSASRNGSGPSNLSSLLDQIGDHIVAVTPLKRLGGNEDLMGTVVFLASEASRHITGQYIAVDGGACISK